MNERFIFISAIFWCLDYLQFAGILSINSSPWLCGSLSSDQRWCLNSTYVHEAFFVCTVSSSPGHTVQTLTHVTQNCWHLDKTKNMFLFLSICRLAPLLTTYVSWNPPCDTQKFHHHKGFESAW